jgi:hypothetical protein
MKLCQTILYHYIYWMDQNATGIPCLKIIKYSWPKNSTKPQQLHKRRLITKKVKISKTTFERRRFNGMHANIQHTQLPVIWTRGRSGHIVYFRSDLLCSRANSFDFSELCALWFPPTARNKLYIALLSLRTEQVTKNYRAGLALTPLPLYRTS